MYVVESGYRAHLPIERASNPILRGIRALEYIGPLRLFSSYTPLYTLPVSLENQSWLQQPLGRYRRSFCTTTGYHAAELGLNLSINVWLPTGRRFLVLERDPSEIGLGRLGPMTVSCRVGDRGEWTSDSLPACSLSVLSPPTLAGAET